jgi:hypothetical protein
MIMVSRAINMSNLVDRYSKICDIRYLIIQKSLLTGKLAKSGLILQCGTTSCFIAFACYRMSQCSA